ncbi:MAG TPA: prepilin-type N-terminal cleavage/methylation domain-containing protein [Fimbriimonadaceae bacterium]|nr:prepilin-type N-terminal cleavage/methylation domain-containing protein [Fimbriimonadaceae bacterium]
MRSKRRGFTLIELITVMTITAVLLTIITVPLVQSFNLTRAAQGFADAQDRARTLIDRVSREVANSAGVRDNTGVRGALIIRLPGRNGNQEEIQIEGIKLDVIKPAQGEESIDPNNPGVFIDPNTGKVDPTLRAPKGQVTLPVAPGSTLVRYFVGLRQPFQVLTNGNVTDNPGTYNNPYDGILMARNGQRDNLYVLFRAEVQPIVWNGGQRQVNTRFFDIGPDGEPVYDDVRFFLPDGTNPKALRVRNWLNAATIVTEISRFDMIQPVFDRRTRVPIYDPNAANVLNVPRVFPLIQFAPTRMTSEPPTGMTAVRPGEETVNSVKIGPDVYRTNFGAWTDILIRTWPTIWPEQWGFGGRIRPSDNPSDVFAGNVRSSWRKTDQPGVLPFNPYLIMDRRQLPEQGVAGPGYSIFLYDPNLGDERTIAARTQLFDVSGYRRDVRNQVDYPFTRNLRTGLLNDQNLRRWALLWSIDPRSGEVLTSFGIDEVGTVPLPPAALDNRPVAACGDAYTPANDPSIGAGQWFNYTNINQRFNKLWNTWSIPGGLLETSRRDNSQPPIDLPRERFAKRYIDLRRQPQADGTPSPLDPIDGFPRASIVPGSEVVIGPDQNPGPSYGQPVRYSRTTQRPVGPNQYLINYVDQREPNWADWDGTGGGTQGFNVPANVYDPTYYDFQSFVSSVLQPQFRAGYVELNSRFGEPLPPGFVTVYYRFQFSEPNDAIAVDYDTRQIMSINLTIRNYPQTTLPNPQTVTVQGSATVRNFIR